MVNFVPLDLRKESR